MCYNEIQCTCHNQCLTILGNDLMLCSHTKSDLVVLGHVQEHAQWLGMFWYRCGAVD